MDGFCALGSFGQTPINSARAIGAYRGHDSLGGGPIGATGRHVIERHLRQLPEYARQGKSKFVNMTNKQLESIIDDVVQTGQVTAQGNRNVYFKQYTEIIGHTRGKPIGGVRVVTEKKLLGENLVTAYPSLS